MRLYLRMNSDEESSQSYGQEEDSNLSVNNLISVNVNSERDCS